jgi:large subunit ribosomal protein L6
LSRVGKNPIVIPSGVKLEIAEHQVKVSGPLGKLEKAIHPSIKVNLEDNSAKDGSASGGKVIVSRPSDSKFHKSLHGLFRMLIYNMVVGVTQGFKKVLLINGVGYKAELSGKFLNLSLGYSHPIVFLPPEGIKIELENPTKIIVSGLDKELVGLVAAKIRAFRPPDPYKAKGIKYEDEWVRRKAGKTAA